MNEIKDEKELEELLKKDKITCLLFYAAWCSLGKSMFALIEEFEYQYKEHLVFRKVDIDKYPNIKKTYKVNSLPIIIVLKQKKVVKRLIGKHSKNRIEKMIKKLLKDKPPKA